MNKITSSLFHYSVIILGLMVTVGIFNFYTYKATAVESITDGEFALQVSPSPLVTTLKPGQTTELTLKIRNVGPTAEELKIEPKAFKFNNATESVELSDKPPAEIVNWLTFSAPKFNVGAGQTFEEKVRISLPKNTGFSYSFALTITRTADPVATKNGGAIKGSLAVFTLVNVDRPGATRRLESVKFVSTKRVYEFLPAELTTQFNNTGNTIIQPAGDIFIEQGSNGSKPISVLAINDKQGYILPDSIRTLKSEWNDGFPVYKTITTTDGKTIKKLTWNWNNLSHLRFGKYTAKLVAIYNDGQRDIPLEATVSFWVIPWRIILGAVVILLLVLFAIWSLIRKLFKVIKRSKKRRP